MQVKRLKLSYKDFWDQMVWPVEQIWAILSELLDHGTKLIDRTLQILPKVLWLPTVQHSFPMNLVFVRTPRYQEAINEKLHKEYLAIEEDTLPLGVECPTKTASCLAEVDQVPEEVL
ncbi:hypothetical protein J4Q44_G00200280 [Coregonus suidteri]|uniref:Uncharacterized protein n=1 Tax=Coregonus suidteri TaxID=861788 RepID=A0AAN8R2N2_9TELE